MHTDTLPPAEAHEWASQSLAACEAKLTFARASQDEAEARLTAARDDAADSVGTVDEPAAAARWRAARERAELAGLGTQRAQKARDEAAAAEAAARVAALRAELEAVRAEGHPSVIIGETAEALDRAHVAKVEADACLARAAAKREALAAREVAILVELHKLAGDKPSAVGVRPERQIRTFNVADLPFIAAARYLPAEPAARRAAAVVLFHEMPSIALRFDGSKVSAAVVAGVTDWAAWAVDVVLVGPDLATTKHRGG